MVKISCHIDFFFPPIFFYKWFLDGLEKTERQY